MATHLQRDELFECAKRIDASLSNIFAGINELRDAAARLWQNLSSGQPSSRDIATLRPLMDRRLTAARGLLQGTGVVLSPGVVQDKDLYLEWRHLNQLGRIAQLGLNFNRSSESFYDYRDKPWFAGPRDTGDSVVAGPYVDLYGQDMYILTFASPIRVDGRFVGIAGADVALNRFENVLVSSLVRLPHEALIVSDEGRVVAANTANWAVGDLARNAFERSSNPGRIVELGEGCARWSLVERPYPRQLAGAA
ncbi:cache domain-containing protein [Zestomonas thermotolerans]|uniref:cache domain-containing protein n=1 Tax=Zestomonas thermotolerans TaxID=157784 RepID=UPI000480B6FC|nr:cache domain-containing protein [Pseudomonas thermotolerans]